MVKEIAYSAGSTGATGAENEPAAGIQASDATRSKSIDPKKSKRRFDEQVAKIGPTH